MPWSILAFSFLWVFPCKLYRSHRGDPLPHDVLEGQLLLEEVPWRPALSRAARRGHDAAVGYTG